MIFIKIIFNHWREKFYQLGLISLKNLIFFGGEDNFMRKSKIILEGNKKNNGMLLELPKKIKFENI